MAQSTKIAPPATPFRAADLLQSIHDTATGLTLAELLALHPAVARRTAQRWLGKAVVGGHIVSLGAALSTQCGPASCGANQPAC